MDPAAKVNPARLTRSLLARSRQGAIATLMPGSGDPYCSLVNVATAADSSSRMRLTTFGAASTSSFSASNWRTARVISRKIS